MSEEQAHASGFRVTRERTHVKRLLAVNPNYFGTAPDLGFEPEISLAGDTTYESLSCVSYSPERDRLEATVQVNRSSGYGGNLCSAGTSENVRFYVSYDEGNTWEDAGAASATVHDIPNGTDCEDASYLPLSYVVGVNYQPQRNWCGSPVLPLVRAILSWEIMPDPQKPDQQPIWGEVVEVHVQITPRPWIFPDIVPFLPELTIPKLPPYLLEQIPSPLPDPGPEKALSLADVTALYSGGEQVEEFTVPAHRFALPHLAATQVSGAMTLDSYVVPAQIAQANELDLPAILGELESASGDTTYEQIMCVGLDNNADQIVGTFHVKRPSGFSGGPCTAGSTEYVAYWADFGGDCSFTYLGTVPVNTHDYTTIPADGLSYAAPLSVNLGQFRKNCDTPVIGRIRAVLSWGTPPSTTNPNAVPYWGNRIDVHVQLRPGDPYDGTARFTIVGGVESSKVDVGTGLTLPGGHIVENGFALPDDCPFAGTVSLHGPLDPALAGGTYRIWVRNISAGTASTPLTSAFYVVNQFGVGSWETPGPMGLTSYPDWHSNTTGMLGYFTPGGDDLWEVQLEVGGTIVDTRRVQMDNTLNNFVNPSDPDDEADLQLFTMGACRLPKGPLNGTFIARDKHFYQWSIGVIGGPDPTVPATPLTVGISQFTQTSTSGEPFTINLSALKPCGYVVQLGITDRAVVSSASFGRTVYVNKGVCLE
ncbi:MAG: hypothetical protein ACTHJM_10925 [Marmoricola sp.]